MSISVLLIGQNSFTNVEKTQETLWANQSQWLLIWSMKSCREQKKPNYKLWKPLETGPGHPESRRKDSECLVQLISCEVCTNTSTGSQKESSRERERDGRRTPVKTAHRDSEEVPNTCLHLSGLGSCLCWDSDLLLHARVRRTCPLSVDKIRKTVCV